MAHMGEGCWLKLKQRIDEQIGHINRVAQFTDDSLVRAELEEIADDLSAIGQELADGGHGT